MLPDVIVQALLVLQTLLDFIDPSRPLWAYDIISSCNFQIMCPYVHCKLITIYLNISDHCLSLFSNPNPKVCLHFCLITSVAKPNYYGIQIYIVGFHNQSLELIKVVLYCTASLVIYCSLKLSNSFHNDINNKELFLKVSILNYILQRRYQQLILCGI